MKRAILAALLTASCASAPVRVDLMALPVCSMDTGASWLPDPCRYEVRPGEWLRVSTPMPEGPGEPAKAKRRPWWAVLLGLLLI